MNTNSLDKCKLLDWSGIEEIVAEGRKVSSDPNEEVNHIPLGPNAMKVLVDISHKPDAFLWRPTSDMTCIKHAQGKTIAWPVERIIIQMDQQSEEQDNISLHLVICFSYKILLLSILIMCVIIYIIYN